MARSHSRNNWIHIRFRTTYGSGTNRVLLLCVKIGIGMPWKVRYRLHIHKKILIIIINIHFVQNNCQSMIIWIVVLLLLCLWSTHQRHKIRLHIQVFFYTISTDLKWEGWEKEMKQRQKKRWKLFFWVTVFWKSIKTSSWWLQLRRNPLLQSS